MVINYGIKKIIKRDSARKALNKYLPQLQNAVFLFGKVGAAKTTTSTSYCQNYKNILGYKWIYLWGGERDEHLYVSIPSQDLNYWDKVKKIHSLEGEGPYQNKVHYLYPYWEKTLPKKLPSDPPNVIHKIFTIPIQSVSVSNISHAIGTVSGDNEFIWTTSLDKIKNNEGPNRLLKIASDLGKSNQTIVKRFVSPVCKNKLLQSSNCEYNLDLLSELKDRDSVLVLCLEFIPEEFKIFVMEWFLSEIKKVLDSHRGMTKNLLMMNEVSEFFKATDDSIMPERYKIFRKSLSQYVRMGRRGMHFFFNAQSPHEARGIVSGQDDYTILCKMTSQPDIEASTDHLRKVKLIRSEQIEKLYRFGPGQFLFCESGKPAISQYYFKPRTFFWEPGMGDFYKYTWPKYNNNWKITEPIKEEIKKIYLEEKKLIEIEEKQKFEEKESKMKLIEDKKQQESLDRDSKKIELEEKKLEVLNKKESIKNQNALEKAQKVEEKRQKQFDELTPEEIQSNKYSPPSDDVLI